MNYLLVGFFFALATAALLVSSHYFGHLLSPFGVFYAVWFGAIGLFFLHWVDYIPVSLATWELVALNLVGFGMGWALAWLIHSPFAQRPQSSIALQAIREDRLRTLILVCFVLGMVGLGDFLWRIQSTLGLATYIVAPHEIREAMSLGGGLAEGLKPLNWLNVLNVVLCSLYIWVLKAPRRLAVSAILIASLAATLLMEDRTRFFYAVLWAGYVLAHARAWNPRKVAFAGVAVVVLLLAQFLTTAAWLGKVAKNIPAIAENANVPPAMLPLITPYVYATANFPALQAYVQSSPPATHGAMTFYPLFKAINQADPTLVPPKIVADFHSIPFGYNTFTWLHQFYTDFGVAGVGLGPLVAGLLAGFLYTYMLRRRTFYSICVNGLVCFSLTLTIMVNQFTNGPAWYFLALGIPIACYLRSSVPSQRVSARFETLPL